MIKKFWSLLRIFLKDLFSTPEYYTRNIVMSRKQFYDMKLFFETHDNIEIEICRTTMTDYKFWKLVTAFDEYNNKVDVVEDVAAYDSKNEIFYYTSGFDELLEKYNTLEK